MTMIWLNPETVTIGGVDLGGVRSIAVAHRADKLVVEFSDGGPHPTFADAPEQRTTITLKRAVVSNEDPGVRPGDEAVFEARIAPTGADTPGVTLSAAVVVTGVASRSDRKSGAEQTIEAVAVSPDGSTDPLAVTPEGSA
jgi:hypothetical protein